MKISQTEARRLKRRVLELERMESSRRAIYGAGYPGGVNIANHAFASDRDYLPAVVGTSRRLGHAVVVVDDGSTLRFYAIPHPRMPA